MNIQKLQDLQREKVDIPCTMYRKLAWFAKEHGLTIT
jgi:hypothetical protein